ncbi:MAG: amino acid ABC transporter substrate-binding protein [Alphaproteobacteria bacterium]|nr:amino acid ABC transporter substrate-binding protein [Alphaproteobacteria bacterium]
MRFALAATLAATLLASPAGAQELTGTLKKIKETGEIAVGYRETSIPFSYLDDKQQPIGFTMDVCARIIEAVKAELKLAKLDVKLTPVNASSRIPLMVNGTIDIECGSTTNNADRQKQVTFTNAHFVVSAKYVTKVAAGIKSIDDLKGKTVVSSAGSTNIKQIIEINAQRKLGMTILPAKDHAEAFLTLDTDRAVAFFMDDVILASYVAVSKNPAAYVLSEDVTAPPEPYGIMLRKDDPSFKKLVDATTRAVFTGPDFPKLYAKWFLEPIPPKGVSLNLPMTATLKKTYANPIDSPDPAAY